MTTTYADSVTPELRLALQQALCAGDAEERGASSARRVQARLIGVLTGTAASLAVCDALLLLVS